MVNWFIVGMTVGSTVFIIVKRMSSMRKGENSCCLEGCSISKSECNCDHNL